MNVPGTIASRNLPALFLTGTLFMHTALALQGKETYYIFFAIYAGFYLFLYKERDIFRHVHHYFTLPAVAAFLLVNFAAIADGRLFSIDRIDLRFCLIPLYMLAAIAGVYRFSNYCSVKSGQIVQAICWGAVAGVLIRLVVHFDQFDLTQLWGATRWPGIFDYNVNLADDFYVTLILISFLGASTSLNNATSIGQRWGAAVFLTILAYAVAYFIQGQSRGGWAAFVVALLATTGVAYVSKRRFAASPIAMILVALIVLLKADVVVDRAGGTIPWATTSMAERLPETMGFLSSLRLLPADARADDVMDVAGGTAAVEPKERAASPQAAEPEDDPYLDISIGIRIQLWRDALNLIALEPMTGLLGRDKAKIRDRSLNPELALMRSHFHNLFLEVTIRFGLVLLLVYLFIFLFFIAVLTRALLSHNNRECYHANGLSIIALFYFIYLPLENLVDVNFHQKGIISLVVLFSAVAGASLSLLRPRVPRQQLV